MTPRSFLIVFGLSALYPTPTHAQSGEVDLKATSANVKESGSPVRVRIVRWSTDEERSPLVAALNPAAPGLPTGAGPSPPAAAGVRGGAGRGGRGGAGRGGRGDAGAAPPNPIAALTAAIGREPTLG